MNGRPSCSVELALYRVMRCRAREGFPGSWRTAGPRSAEHSQKCKGGMELVSAENPPLGV